MDRKFKDEGPTFAQMYQGIIDIQLEKALGEKLKKRKLDDPFEVGDKI